MDIDERMMSRLPDYWQQYFTSKSQHRQFMPNDASIKAISEGMTPPQVLNSIDPSSNEYAQTYGIAGMELLRTVVDATGEFRARWRSPAQSVLGWMKRRWTRSRTRASRRLP